MSFTPYLPTSLVPSLSLALPTSFPPSLTSDGESDVPGKANPHQSGMQGGEGDSEEAGAPAGVLGHRISW